MATLPSTLILYLWAVLVWQWENRFCLSETCLKWQCRSKVPPNARCVPSYDFSTQKVNVQREFTNKLLLFMVTLWIGKMWRSGAVNSPKEGLMFATNKGVVIVNILGTQRAHNFLYPNFSITASWIVVLDTFGNDVMQLSYRQASICANFSFSFLKKVVRDQRCPTAPLFVVNTFLRRIHGTTSSQFADS